MEIKKAEILDRSVQGSAEAQLLALSSLKKLWTRVFAHDKIIRTVKNDGTSAHFLVGNEFFPFWVTQFPNDVNEFMEKQHLLIILYLYQFFLLLSPVWSFCQRHPILVVGASPSHHKQLLCGGKISLEGTFISAHQTISENLINF